jgi:CheY-like chemotaxis protein
LLAFLAVTAEEGHVADTSTHEREQRRHATDEHLPMVAMTGWGREEDRRQTREAGLDHHLVKPVAANSPDQLLRIVAT